MTNKPELSFDLASGTDEGVKTLVIVNLGKVTPIKQRLKMTTKPICPYCGNESKLVTGLDIYPKRPHLANFPYYQCSPCDAYVGCHKGTTEPLGRLADKELRRWKAIVHSGFDKIWRGFDGSKNDELQFDDPIEAIKTFPRMGRSRAYQYLAETMMIDRKDCHIGMFDLHQCKTAYTISQQGFEHEKIALADYMFSLHEAKKERNK